MKNEIFLWEINEQMDWFTLFRAFVVAQLVKNLPAVRETWVQSQLGIEDPNLGRSPGEGNSYPLQYSGLEDSMDYIGHGVAKSWAWLSDFQKESTLFIAWKTEYCYNFNSLQIDF